MVVSSFAEWRAYPTDISGYCLQRLVSQLCWSLLIAVALQGSWLRNAIAQQPNFGAPGTNFSQNPISVPTVPNNPTSFGAGSPNNAPAENYPSTGNNPTAGNYPTTENYSTTGNYPTTGTYSPAANTAPAGKYPPPNYPNTGAVPPPVATPRVASNQAPEAKLVPLEGGEIIARVGGLVIVAGDILPRVNHIIKEQLSKLPPEQLAQVPPEEIDKAKRQFMQKELLSLIETKLLFSDAKRTTPKDNLPKVMDKLNEQFEKVELPHLLQDAKVTNRQALDEKFAQQGTSLAQQKQAFSERLLATEWLKQHVDFKRVPTHDEMLAYYHEHLSDYDFDAKAKFEEIMVRFDRYPNKAAAYAALAALGNQLLSGANFGDLAKAQSQGPTAREEGQYGFVSPGSLVLPILNEAVFTLPVGQLSQILESDNGFHIIRVLERHDAGRTPFEDTQEEIAKKLQRSETDKQIKEYLAKLRRETRVWTVFDGPVEQEASKPE